MIFLVGMTLGQRSWSLQSKFNIDTCTYIYTEQNKKRNNNIPPNFEQTIIHSEIIAFSAPALDCKKPIFILMSISEVIRCHAKSSKTLSAHAQPLK